MEPSTSQSIHLDLIEKNFLEDTYLNRSAIYGVANQVKAPEAELSLSDFAVISLGLIASLIYKIGCDYAYDNKQSSNSNISYLKWTILGIGCSLLIYEVISTAKEKHSFKATKELKNEKVALTKILEKYEDLHVVAATDFEAIRKRAPSLSEHFLKARICPDKLAASINDFISSNRHIENLIVEILSDGDNSQILRLEQICKKCFGYDYHWIHVKKVERLIIEKLNIIGKMGRQYVEKMQDFALTYADGQYIQLALACEDYLGNKI
jgi:hypothetical protein